MTGPMKVSAAEFQRQSGRYFDLALTQPVVITRNGRERTVMISTEEYQRLKRRDREVLRAEDFTETELDSIAVSAPPPAADAFDDELDR
ncbi:MAG: type II toxin-antitoxin system Phd/YefM family antitoxin [Rhizobium rhizophilum]|uniref:type II toxin-antitoxin system Phd/YefM family antitoxin n=1 Tax=Rhizobium rhizophilum TaxID=1850373 RepID=UPI003919C554